MVFVAKILKPPVVFISCCAVLWTGWLLFQCRRHGRGILFLWGLRVDNLPRSLVLPSFFAIFAILIISLVSVGDGRDIVAPLHTWRFWLMMALYPLWGVLAVPLMPFFPQLLQQQASIAGPPAEWTMDILLEYCALHCSGGRGLSWMDAFV
eukprot:Skav213242  [mRNA]  locus=scaffold2594:112503:123624:- [translate_table: standard]